MRRIAAIDIGASAAKGIIFNGEGEIRGTSYSSCSGADYEPQRELGKVIAELSSIAGAPEKIILTGVGATYPGLAEGDDRSFVQELSAVGIGGLVSSGENEALIMSMGTGTAYMYADKTGCRHLGGSAMGGGTIRGLAAKMLGTRSIMEISVLAGKGNANNVDVLLSEVAKSGTDTLTLDLTSSNFAKADANTTREDLAAGIVNLVLQNLGVMAVFAARSCGTKTCVMTGALTGISTLPGIFERIEAAFGVRFIVPKLAPFATAIGAAAIEMGMDFPKI